LCVCVCVCVCVGYFRDWVLHTIYPGWPWTAVLISASWVARIIGVSHLRPAWMWLTEVIKWKSAVCWKAEVGEHKSSIHSAEL
jgi:hypothetical protein